MMKKKMLSFLAVISLFLGMAPVIFADSFDRDHERDRWDHEERDRDRWDHEYDRWNHDSDWDRDYGRERERDRDFDRDPGREWDRPEFARAQCHAVLLTDRGFPIRSFSSLGRGMNPYEARRMACMRAMRECRNFARMPGPLDPHRRIDPRFGSHFERRPEMRPDFYGRPYCRVELAR